MYELYVDLVNRLLQKLEARELERVDALKQSLQGFARYGIICFFKIRLLTDHNPYIKFKSNILCLGAGMVT